MSDPTAPPRRTGTIVVLRGDHQASGVTRGGAYCFGTHVLFRIEIHGPGRLDWSFEAVSAQLDVTAIHDADESTRVVVESFGVRPLNIRRVDVTSPIGRLDLIGRVGVVRAVEACAASISVAGEVESVEFGADFSGKLRVCGDVGAIHVDGSLRDGPPLEIGGDLEHLGCRFLERSVRVDGNCSSMTMSRIEGGITLAVGGRLGSVAVTRGVGSPGQPAIISAQQLLGFTARGRVTAHVNVVDRICSFTTLGHSPVGGSIVARRIDYLIIGGRFDADLEVRDGVGVVAIAGRLTPGRFEVGGTIGLLALEERVERPIRAGAILERSAPRPSDEIARLFHAGADFDYVARSFEAFENENPRKAERIAGLGEESVSEATEADGWGDATFEAPRATNAASEAAPPIPSRPEIDEAWSIGASWASEGAEVQPFDFSEFEPAAAPTAEREAAPAEAEPEPPATTEEPFVDVELIPLDDTVTDDTSPPVAFDGSTATDVTGLGVETEMELDEGGVAEAELVETAFESLAEEDDGSITIAFEEGAFVPDVEPDSPPIDDEETWQVVTLEDGSHSDDADVDDDDEVIGFDTDDLEELGIEIEPDWRDLVRGAHAEGKSFTELFEPTARYVYGLEPDVLVPVEGDLDVLPKIGLDDTDPAAAWLWGLLRPLAEPRAKKETRPTEGLHAEGAQMAGEAVAASLAPMHADEEFIEADSMEFDADLADLGTSDHEFGAFEPDEDDEDFPDVGPEPDSHEFESTE
ncbi:MAG: hypothetical protein AAF488_00890 [Planctomycetota bacterium]